MSNIIQIGEWSVQRRARSASSPQAGCDHAQIALESHGQVVRCLKCGDQLSAFWALQMLADQYDRATAELEQERRALARAREAELHLPAALKVEQLWRGRKLAPACPHCGRGILPEDGLGSLQINQEFELRRRAAQSHGEPGHASPQGGSAGGCA